MKRYDPDVQPVASEWLALDEERRMRLAERYHRAAGEPVPNLKAHAAFHAIVENQIAEGLEPVVRAIARLVRQGLSRHDALHAVASVLTDLLFEGRNTKDESFAAAMPARYNAAVEQLTAEKWRHKYD